MVRKFSWLGVLLAGVYALLSSYFIYLGVTCSTLFCEIAPVLPILIWTPLIELFLKDLFSAGPIVSFVLYLLFFCTNIVLLYIGGFFIGRYAKRYFAGTEEETY